MWRGAADERRQRALVRHPARRRALTSTMRGSRFAVRLAAVVVWDAASEHRQVDGARGGSYERCARKRFGRSLTTVCPRAVCGRTSHRPDPPMDVRMPASWSALRRRRQMAAGAAAAVDAGIRLRTVMTPAMRPCVARAPATRVLGLRTRSRRTSRCDERADLHRADARAACWSRRTIWRGDSLTTRPEPPAATA